MPRMATPKTSSDHYRIAYIDIETSPNLAWVWGMYEQNVIRFQAEWIILSFSVKWAGSPKVETYALCDFPLYYADPLDDLAVVRKLRSVLDEADLVVWHNGDKFDGPKINARMVYHGMTPPSPYQTVDTLKLARKFAFNSKKLNDLAQHLHIGKKAKHNGFETWLGCLNQDAAAWKVMKKYNGMDVVLLEKVHQRLRPWHKTHPDVTWKSGSLKAHCPACGKTRLEKRGWSPVGMYYRARRYHCLNPRCGKWSLGEREKVPGAKLR